MPKNSFYAPREKEANKQNTQALSSFFWKRRGYFPLIIEFAFLEGHLGCFMCHVWNTDRVLGTYLIELFWRLNEFKSLKYLEPSP